MRQSHAKGDCSHVCHNSVFANCCACAIGKRLRFGSARGGRTRLIAVGSAVCALAGLPLHPEQLGGRGGETLVAERLGAGRADHRARRRSRLPGRAAARRHALWLLAVAIPRAQGAAGDDSARQDRLRVRPRRRAAAAQPDAWASTSRATTIRTPARFSWASPKATAQCVAASAAASARSCAKACTPSTRPCLS